MDALCCIHRPGQDQPMHLTHLTINPHIASRLGLRENTMSDLGSVVVLVGENGCGKTRILEAVDWLLRRTRHIGHARLVKLRAAEVRQEQVFREFTVYPPDDNWTFAGAGSDLNAYKALLSPLEGFELAAADGEDLDAAIAAYCALSDTLRNSFTSHREYIARLGVGVPRGDNTTDPLLVGAPLVYIEDICVRQAAELAEEPMGLHSAHSGIDGEYRRLQELLFEVAGMRLSIADGQACLNERTIPHTAFSDGQIALLRVAVLIHSRALENAPVPILLDEPERHLHPSRLVGLIDALRVHLPRAQLWIATHSLSLTAHLAAREPRAIWFGENGHFERAGLAQDKVVNGLLGGPAGAEQISDFCVRADQFAACAFSADCLCPPETATYKEGDPQVQQIRDFIGGEHARRLTIVDIGAGQGRLIDGLSHLLGAALSDHVSYYAIEPNEVTRALCVQTVRRHFDDGTARVFGSAQQFLASAAISADVAVMVNVLHEIEIENWAAVLHDAYTLLANTGSLLIVEDTRLPRGELAHANGFLILETEALCELFKTSRSADGVRCVAASRSGSRLQATAFRKTHLAAITTSSIEGALLTQRDIAIRRIRELRRSGRKPDYRLGHEHAYHAQLVANLTLALEELQATPLQQ